MLRFNSANEAHDALKDGAVAIGNFDGVHLGHQALIDRALKLRGENCAGVLTFSPHPREILQNEPLFYLTSDDQREDLFEHLGVDVAILQKIDTAFLSMSAEEFIEKVLIHELKVRHVVVGNDFTFGHHALGDVAMLKALGAKHGFTTHVVSEVATLYKRCSSSAIRSFLHNGDVKSAHAMLGRPFSVRDVVRHGQKKGAGLGFRTANLVPKAGFDLRRGIYATVTRVFSQQNADYLSATSVGVRPTVTDDPTLVVETHVLNKTLALYDQTIEVFFIAWLRDEIKFASLDKLIAQIQKDCHDIEALYHNQKADFIVAP